MSALSANNPSVVTNPLAWVEFPVKGSKHIYQGARVMLVGGYLLPAADTSGGRFVGIALEEANNTGADGAITCKVQLAETEPIHTVAIASAATQATVGVNVFLVDDQTVDIAANSTNKVAYGMVVKFLSAGWVQVNTAARFTPASAA